MYAIINKRTKKWVFGTDFNYYPHRQRTSFDNVAIYSDLREAQFRFEWRGCGRDYKIVEVEVKIKGE